MYGNVKNFFNKILIFKKMKKISLMSFVIFAFAINAQAYKETTTTTTVPGDAKTVSTTPDGTTTINCEHSIFTCYTKTTTTIERNGIQSIKVGSQVVLDVTDQNGTPHHIVGGFLNQKVENFSDGTAYSFTLSETWE